jgi:hypothetical protein
MIVWIAHLMCVQVGQIIVERSVQNVVGSNLNMPQTGNSKRFRLSDERQISREFCTEKRH